MFLGFDEVDPSSILVVLIGIDELEALEGSQSEILYIYKYVLFKNIDIFLIYICFLVNYYYIKYSIKLIYL